MRYKTKRQEIIDFINDIIVPALYERTDIDYNKLISFLIIERGSTKSIAEECVEQFINLGKIKREGNILTIPDAKITDYLKLIKSKEKQDEEIKKDLEFLEANAAIKKEEVING